ncbi:MAG: DNA-directed RNA polymerase subunit omega [Candidatus Omnitrophota bacterium]|nr:DNA-directed RNA polymerase subunit omega [Candidatus Omnitrophota bacterium]
MRQPIENLLPRAEWSVYKLVRLAALRAQELADGKPKLVEMSMSEKITTIALEEILKGKVMTKQAAADRTEALSKESKKK